MSCTLRWIGASAFVLGVMGGGVAAAAPGGGAVTVPSTCLISLPGLFPDVTGTARIVVTPQGGQRVSCHAQLPAGVAPPAKALRIASGSTLIVVTPSGQINAHSSF